MSNIKSEIGVIGLGTMGAALAQNFLSKSFSLAVFNRDFKKAQNLPVKEGQKLSAFEKIEDFVNNLQSPRKIIMMLPAGSPVDSMIETLLPLLDKGDILLDGGNSYFKDTQKRAAYLEEIGICYFGLGVSGGEEGALKGPSLMPGGNKEAYAHIKNYLESIAAKEKSDPCCAYIGSDGAGHYVKMVHNGIEYADMQLLAEVYLLLKELIGLSNAQISAVFEEWNKGELRSYLVEISAKVLLEKNPEGAGELIDFIVDKAGQKGTGSWTAINALEQGQAVSLIDLAVQARIVSNSDELRQRYRKQNEREKALKNLSFSSNSSISSIIEEVEWIRKAYYLSKAMAYAQGFALMHSASKLYSWNLDLASIASIFRKGCIIQAELLEVIMQSFAKSTKNENRFEHLLLNNDWQEIVIDYMPYLRKTVLALVENAIPAPLISASLCYLDQISSPLLGANLIQGQRDFFGAHTFERIDKEGAMHHEWQQ